MHEAFEKILAPDFISLSEPLPENREYNRSAGAGLVRKLMALLSPGLFNRLVQNSRRGRDQQQFSV